MSTCHSLPETNENHPTPLQSLQLFAAELLATVQPENEERASRRYPFVVPVVVVPVGDDYQPIGQAFEAVTCDVSTIGLRLISTQAVSASLLRLELTFASGTKIPVVIEVARCRPISQFYEIAGPLVARLDH